MSSSASAEAIFKDYQEWRLIRTPEYASLVGESRYNDSLEEYTLDRFKEDHDKCQEFLAAAKDVLKKDDLSDGDKLNLRLFEAEVETFVSGYECQGFLFPINYMEGVHIDFERLAGWVTFLSIKDYEDMIERYKKFDRQAQQIIDTMRVGIQQGMVNHAVSMKGVPDVFQNHLEKDPRDTVFYEPFLSMPNAFTEEEKQKLQNDAATAIASYVQSGMSKLKCFVEDEYMKHTRPDIAITSLPKGDKFYRQCIKFHTSTTMTPQEIHDTGLKEVDRIEGEMKKIVKDLGYDMTLNQFMEVLRNDSKHYYDSKDEVLLGFKEIVEKRIAPKISKLFTTPPLQALELVSSPQGEAPAAFYIAGTADGARPGRFFVNDKKYESQPKYDMVTLALHEGNPGHHLQASFLMSHPDVPDFRRVMEDRSYFLCPSRFPINTAYTEGWALYAESLGFEMGLFDDPYERFGHLSASIFRACRLVVDTGLHALGWSRQRAVDFMKEHSASPMTHIELEVDRYITWPGQALGYKLGELRIRQLRREAEEALGSLDVRSFHDVVLSAVGPLEVLEEEVRKYIEDQKK